MIVGLLKRGFVRKRLAPCLCMLCALLAAPVSGAAADYTTGTPGGAGKIIIDPETGDRKVEVTAPPPAVRDQQRMPVYVYPQVETPGRHPPSPGPKPAPLPRNR